MFFGDEAIAGISITNRVFLVVISIMFGLGQGFQPVAGFCFGAKKLDRVKKAFFFTLILSTFLQVIFSILLYRFASPVVSFFQKDSEVVKIGTWAVRFFAISIPFLPISIITNMLFQVGGENKKSIFLSSCRQGIFFIPLIFTLPLFFGITGLELCQPISNILSALVSLPFLISFIKNMNKKLSTTSKMG